MPATAGARDVLSGPPKRIGTVLIGMTTIGQATWATTRDVVSGSGSIRSGMSKCGTFKCGELTWITARDTFSPTAGGRDIL